jgi:hypothetical protein
LLTSPFLIEEASIATARALGVSKINVARQSRIGAKPDVSAFAVTLLSACSV